MVKRSCALAVAVAVLVAGCSGSRPHSHAGVAPVRTTSGRPAPQPSGSSGRTPTSTLPPVSAHPTGPNGPTRSGGSSGSTPRSTCPARAGGTTGGRARQAIWFPPLGEQHEWPDQYAPLRACSSSGLPIRYRILTDDTTQNCVLEPQQHPTEVHGDDTPATCAVEAEQTGDSRYAPATPVVRRYRMDLLETTLTAAGPSSPVPLSQSPVVVRATVSADWPAGQVILDVSNGGARDWGVPPAEDLLVEITRRTQEVDIPITLRRPVKTIFTGGACNLTVYLSATQRLSGDSTPVYFTVTMG